MIYLFYVYEKFYFARTSVVCQLIFLPVGPLIIRLRIQIHAFMDTEGHVINNIQNVKLTRHLSSTSSLIFIQICIIIRSLIINHKYCSRTQ